MKKGTVGRILGAALSIAVAFLNRRKPKPPPQPVPVPVPDPPAPIIERAFPPERGRLVRDGPYLRTEDGAIWDKRGATLFMLLARFDRGEDITPQIRWMQRVGVNVARVFIAGHPGIAEFDPFVERWRDPVFWTTVHAFLDRMAAEGLRVEITVITDESKSRETWRELMQKTYDEVQTHWNVLVEWCNEPTSRAERGPVLDWIIQQGIDTHGVVTAYGYDLVGVSEAEGNFVMPYPVADWVTARTGRDREHFYHNGKELMERRSVVGAPIDDDEPMGIAEPGTPGQRTWDELAVACHFAVCRLFGMGATIHSQIGLSGLAPTADTPVQLALSEAVGRVWSFIPGEAQAGDYLAPHRGGWPVVWVAAQDSAVNHAYGKQLGDVAYIVNVASRDGWTAEALPGWRIDAVGPYPWIARVVRA